MVCCGYHMTAVLESSTPHLNHQVTTGMVEVIRFGSEISMFQKDLFANSASQVASHRLWAFTFCYPKQSRLSRSGDKVYLSQENFAKLAKLEELHFCVRIGNLFAPNDVPALRSMDLGVVRCRTSNGTKP